MTCFQQQLHQDHHFIQIHLFFIHLVIHQRQIQHQEQQSLPYQYDLNVTTHHHHYFGQIHRIFNEI